MRIGILAAAALVWAAVAGPAGAQGDEEIVVTGSFVGAYARDYDTLPIPHVTLIKRADFAIVRLIVRSDTRDLSQRHDELRQALRNLEARAGGASIALRLEDQDAGLVRAFSLAAALEAVRSGNRTDTSQIQILLRTPVSPSDTLDAIHKRIVGFLAATPKPGRVELEPGDLELTLLEPERHRAPLLTAIAADGREAASIVGPGYGMQLSGLDRRVAWRRSGDLELTLFIPYRLDITPTAPR